MSIIIRQPSEAFVDGPPIARDPEDGVDSGAKGERRPAAMGGGAERPDAQGAEGNTEKKNTRARTVVRYVQKHMMTSR